jgi:hypothetical protein
MFVEGEWVHAQGDADDFDYSIDTLNAGVGLQGPLGKQGFASSSVGLSLQLPEFETDSDDLDGDLGVGPYGAVEGGWRATEVVEPYARMLGAIYFPDASTYFSAELGVRFHVIECCALFGAWRYAHYSVDGLDGAAGDDSVGLDVTGPVLGLSFSF